MATPPEHARLNANNVLQFWHNHLDEGDQEFLRWSENYPHAYNDLDRAREACLWLRHKLVPEEWQEDCRAYAVSVLEAYIDGRMLTVA